MSRKSRKNVGLIGLGIIGSRVVNALRHAGWQVYVWNRTPRPAPNFLRSPAEVADLCDLIQIFVADPKALFDVLGAMEERLTSDHLIMCNATVGPEATLKAAELVTGKGARFLDAPFTGSKAAAEARQLVYYIGGSDDAFQLAEPVLKASSKAIVRIGEIGQAATVKIATNMLAATAVQTLVETLAMIERCGVDPAMMTAALEHHGVRSGLLDMKLKQILARDYAPHFSLKHMLKDVEIGMNMAGAHQLRTPAILATANVMYEGMEQGWADLDFSVVAKNYQSEAAPETEFAAKPEEKPAFPQTEPAAAEQEPSEKKEPEAPNGSIVTPSKEIEVEVVGAVKPAETAKGDKSNRLLRRLFRTG